MKKTIGLLTSGGDCQGLNAAMCGVAKSLYKSLGEKIQFVGIEDGYKGLIQGKYRYMEREDFSGILTRGGTILGTSRQPFKELRVIGKDGVDKVKAMKDTYHKLNLDGLVVMGGNGTHKTANALSQEGLNILTLPKTIDNDLWGTEISFGFDSALQIATEVIDAIHTTADAHSRIFIVEIMGHHVGWLPLYAGVASGADIILIPEIPYDIHAMVRTLKERENHGKKFSILAVSEGALSKTEAAMTKKERKAYRNAHKYPSISYRIAEELEEHYDKEVRVTVPGHFQRGGSPSPQDRVLATRFGAAAADLILADQYGYMLGMQDGRITPVPLEEVAGKLKTVPLDADILRYAREIGISFGD